MQKITPFSITGWQILGRSLIGLIVGFFFSVLLFLALGVSGNFFVGLLQQESASASVLASLIILFVGFVVSFVGNSFVAIAWHFFFPDQYKDFKKTLGFTLLGNALLFVFLAPLYFLAVSQIFFIFVVLGLHVALSVFLSMSFMEFVARPPYAAFSLVGSGLGLSLTILFFGAVLLRTRGKPLDSVMPVLLLAPMMLAFFLFPLGAGIREKLYGRIYDLGNDPLLLKWEIEENDVEDDDPDEGISVSVGGRV